MCMKGQRLVLLVVMLMIVSGCRLRSSDTAEQRGRIIAPGEVTNSADYQALLDELEQTRDSLVIANSMLETLEGNYYSSSDSLMRRRSSSKAAARLCP